ncbi:hypothetical protein FB451DRAFT_1265104 [Mycena latifolia]|nr:hypothetical protein FB451DRAFT_1265104 [Mycena latifolia]
MPANKNQQKTKKSRQAKERKTKELKEPRVAKEKKTKEPKEPRPTVKLRIIGPKTPQDKAASPEPLEPTPPAASPELRNPSPQITPPPPLSEKERRTALHAYYAAKKLVAAPGPVPSMSEDEEHSETEAFLIEKGTARQETIFSDGFEIEEDDELEEDKDELEEANQEDGLEDEDDDDEESLSDESDDEELPFELKFSVPFEGAEEKISVMSDILHKDLVSKLADIMSVPPKSVRVAYRFSTQLRSDSYSHLSTGIHLMELVKSARDTIATTRSKKVFIVELKDLEAANRKGKAASKKAVKEKKRKRAGDSDSEDSAGSVDADGKKKKKKSLPQWVAELEAANACTEHRGHGCIKFVTGHVQLSKQDLGTWAIFMTNGYPSTTTPPPKLQVGGNKPAASAKAAPPAVPASLAASGPINAMHGMPPFGYPPFPWQWPPFQTPPQPSTMNRHGRYDDMPSSDPPEMAEDSRLFPRIGNWLPELDEGPRGADGHNFSQYAPDFDREKYIRIVDLESLKINDLKTLIPEMAHGTAAKMLAYATTDIGLIRKRERKRLRMEAQNGSRYT